jgi:phosphatidylglycerophosphate synthase
MGVYRARDLLLVPSLVSLLRLPLAALFPFVLHRPAWAFAVLAASAFTDVLDGWWARRFGQVTAIGTVVDPITDKAFVLTVVITLVVKQHLSLVDVALLSTREIGELPLVIWVALSHRARQARKETPMANVPGKLATAAQFVTVGAIILGAAHGPVLVAVTAAMGAVAAASYWARELRRARA